MNSMDLNLKTKPEKTQQQQKPPKTPNWHNWGFFYEYLKDIKWKY